MLSDAAHDMAHDLVEEIMHYEALFDNKLGNIYPTKMIIDSLTYLFMLTVRADKTQLEEPYFPTLKWTREVARYLAINALKDAGFKRKLPKLVKPKWEDSGCCKRQPVNLINVTKLTGPTSHEERFDIEGSLCAALQMPEIVGTYTH